MTTFHLFPNLPGELRNAIWELTPEPREVIVQGHNQAISHSGSNRKTRTVVRFTSSTPTLGALQACRESRHLLSAGHYARAFGNAISPHYVWVAFALDTIRVPNTHLYSLICHADSPAIRYLAIDCVAHTFSQALVFDPDMAKCQKLLLTLPALERVSVVSELEIGNTCCSDKWRMVLGPRGEIIFPGGRSRPEPTIEWPKDHWSNHWTIRFANTGEMAPLEHLEMYCDIRRARAAGYPETQAAISQSTTRSRTEARRAAVVDSSSESQSSDDGSGGDDTE
ncbi:hypothetical protein QBC39DRAFT_371908 [Podospora conica]|nr:hypothetical protein QBC39DRAFT_371908 [Schizothecium conicum]